MKNSKSPLSSWLMLVAVFGLWIATVTAFVTTAHAQTPAAAVAASDDAAPPALITTAENFATPFIVAFAQTHAWLATIIAFIGMLRLVAKPLMTLVEVYVKNSPSTADDALVAKVEHSFAAKIVYWLLDFGASIKLGSQAAPAPAKPAPPAQP